VLHKKILFALSQWNLLIILAQQMDSLRKELEELKAAAAAAEQQQQQLLLLLLLSWRALGPLGPPWQRR
jgi:hypothetical protein